MSKDKETLEFLKAISALLEKQKQLIEQLQIVIRDYSTSF